LYVERGEQGFRVSGLIGAEAVAIVLRHLDDVARFVATIASVSTVTLRLHY
jgi:hypothetical protein